jgi:hypothetical protein
MIAWSGAAVIADLEASAECPVPDFLRASAVAGHVCPALDRMTGGSVTGQGIPGTAGTTTAPAGTCRSAGSASLSAVPAGGAGTGAGREPRSLFPLVMAFRTAMARTWARAVRKVWRCSASQVRAWDWSQPNASFPVGT